MSILKGQRESCYCAFCKTPRKIYRNRRIGLRHILVSLIASIALMWGIWETVNPAAMAFFIMFLLFSEVFVYLRWRVALVCRQCGFDPSVYLKNPELASKRVEAFLLKRKSDPRFLLAPVLDLAKRPVKVSINPRLFEKTSAGRSQVPQKSTRTGKIISKSV